MRLKTKSRKGLDADISGPRKRFRQLIAYYYQGGVWKKVKKVRGL